MTSSQYMIDTSACDAVVLACEIDDALQGVSAPVSLWRLVLQDDSKDLGTHGRLSVRCMTLSHFQSKLCDRSQFKNINFSLICVI
jgi:hypothetical protein